MDYPKRKLFLKEDSGLSTGSSDARWTCFSRVDQVFTRNHPADDHVVASVSEWLKGVDFIDENEREMYAMRGKNNLRKLISAAIIATGQMSVMSDVTSDEILWSRTGRRRMPQPELMAGAPSNLAVTSDGIRMMHGRPYSPWTRYAQHTPGYETEIDTPSLVSTPGTETLEQSYDIVTEEELSTSKMEYPGMALERLTMKKEKLKNEKSEVKPEVKLEVESEVKPEVKLEVEPEVKLEVEPEIEPTDSLLVNTPSNVSVDNGLSRPLLKPKVLRRLINEEKGEDLMAKFTPEVKKDPKVNWAKLTSAQLSTPVRQMAENWKMFQNEDQTNIKKKDSNQRDLTQRPKSTRQSARRGQSKGAFKGMCD